LNGDFETRAEIKKLYKGKFKLDSDFEGSTIGKTLLEPTKIYVKDMANIAKDFDVVGINNTGYGLKNLNRVVGFEFVVDNPIKPDPIFKLLQDESKESDEKMYSTYNMGMGFFIIANPEDAESIIQSTKDSQIIGEVKKGAKKDSSITILEKNNKKITFDRY
jgi:phosphoribosylformylglycinamidine cyclo-ligase